jgi:TP901 family phage tail tape measure protein
MSSSSVKAGGVFVEIGADPRAFFAALNKVNKALGNMGRAVAGAGAKATAIGVGTLAPFAAAVRRGAAYQSTLLNIKASTGATAAELDKLRAASMAMSQAMGIGPTQVTQSFLELLKAGQTVEQVLGGAGKAAIEFAAVGQMDVAQAAVVMADAMKVFGVDAEKAANSISSAADASSTSIELLSQSFSQVSAVAALANQSIDDTSAALAILANAGVKGSDAGTSLKTMLLRLMAPADDAVGALDSIGLSVGSFRDASGKMLPLVKIIEVLNGKLGGLDQAAKDDIFRRIFGSDAVRAASILTSTGVQGFNDMTTAMGGALSVGDKYKTLMSGLAGAGTRVMAAMERFAIAVSDAVGPALTAVAKPVADLIDGLATFATNNKEVVQQIAKFGVAAVAVGTALVVVGSGLQALSFGFGGILKAVGAIAPAISLLLGPVGLTVAAITALVVLGPQLKGAFSGAFDGIAAVAGSLGQTFQTLAADASVVFSDLASTATTTFNGIYDAVAGGDLSGAMDVLWAGLQAGWLRGVEALMGYVDPWVSLFQNTFTVLGAEIYKTWDTVWLNVSNSFNTFGAVLQDAFDNVINGVLAAWDTLESGIRKSWNYVQSFFKKGFDLKTENEKVTNEMDARRRKRELERPGVEGRTKVAAEQNDKATKERDKRAAAVDANTQSVIDGREAANRQRAGERRAATQAAEGRLQSTSRGKTESRAKNDQFMRLLKDIENASTIDGLRDMYGEFDALSQNGRLTSGQISTLETALEDAQERVSRDMATMGSPASRQAQSGAEGAGAGAAMSKSEVAGTFSSAAVSGMGFGTSLAQKQLDVLTKIERNTGKDGAEVQS